MWPLVAPLPPSSNNANTSSTAAASSQTGGVTGGILPHHPPMPLPPYHHHHPHHHMIPPPCVPPPFHPMGMPPPHLKYHPHHHSGASSSQQPHQQGQAGPHHPLLPPPPPPGLPLVGAGGTGQQQGNMYQNSFNHLPPGIPPPMPLVTGGANLNNSNSLNAPNARMNNNGNMTAGGTNLNNHNNILLQGSMGAGHQGMLITNNQHHHHGMSGAGNLLLNNNSNPNNFTNNNLNHSSKFGVKNGLWAHNNLPNLLPGATPGNSDSAAFWNSNHNATAVSSSANLGINGGGGAFGKKFDSFSNMVTNGSHITNQQHHNTNSSLSSMFNMGALLGDNIESIWKNTSDNSLTSNINNVNDDCNNNSSAGFNPFPPPKTLGNKGSIGNFDNSHNINYNNFNTQSSTSVIQNNNNYNNTKNANNATLNKMGDMTTNSFFGGRDGTSAFDYKSTPSGSSSLLSGFENRLFPPYNNTFNGNSSENGNINAQSFDDVFSPSSLDGTNMNDSIMGGGLVNKVSSNYPNTGNNYDKWNSIGSGFRGDATHNSASHTPSNASTNKSFSSAIAGAAMAEPMTKMKATAVSDDDRDITGTSLWAANANASSNNKSNTSEFLGLRSGSSGLSSAHFGENFGNPNISNNNISNNNCNNMNNGNQVEDRFTKQPRIPTASDDTFSHQLPQQTIYPTDITNLNANTNTPNNVNSFDSNTNTNVMEKSKETGGGVNDELIRQFINTTNGWGRIPIKQDTSWDMCGDDEETLTFASGPTTAVRNMGSSSCINTSSTAVCSFDPNTLGTNLWKSQNDSNSMMMAPQNTVGSVNFMLNQQMSANINNASSLNPNLGGLQPNGMGSFNATNVNVNAKSNSDNFSSNISSPRSAGGSSSFMYNNTNNNNNGNSSNQNENETANYWFSGGGGTSTLTKDANSDTRLPMLRQLSSSTGSSLSNNNHNNANNANNASNFFHLPSSSSTHQQTFPYNNSNQNGNIGLESSNNNNNYSSTTSANPNGGNYNGGTKMNDYYNGNGTLVRGTSNFANTNNANNNNAENDEDEDGEDGGIGVWKSVEAAKQETSMYWNPNLINDMANGESLSVLDNVPHSTTLNNRNGNSHYNAANYGGKLSSNLNDFHRSNNNNNNTYNHNNEPTIPMNSHEGVFPMYPPSNQNNANINNINNNNNIYANTIQSSNPRNIENNSLTSDMMLIQNQQQKLNIPALKKSYSSLLNNGNCSNVSSSLNQNYNAALGSNNFVHNNNNNLINSNDAKSYYNKENAASSHMNNSTTHYSTNNFLSGTTTFNKTNMIPAPSLLFNNNNNKPSVADYHANPPMPEIDDGTDIWARNVVNNNANMGGNNANFMMEQHQHSNKFLAAGNSHPHNATNGNKFNSNNPPLSMNHFGNNHSNGFNKHCNNNDVNMFQYHNQNERNSTFNSTTEFDTLINNNVFGNPGGNGNNINNNTTNNARIGPLFSTNKPQTTQNFMGQNAFGSMQQKNSLQNNFQNMGESSLLSNSTNTVIISNGSISSPTAPHNRNANEMPITNNNATKIAPSTHYLTNCSTPNMVTATKNTNNSSNSTNNCNNNTSSSSFNNGKEDMAKLIPILSTKLSREALELLASQNAAFFEEFLHECLKLIHNGNGNSQNSNTDWANRINVQTLQAILIELVMKKRKQQLIANNNNTSSSVVGQGHNQMSATGCGADILASCANNNNNNSTTNQHE